MSSRQQVFLALGICAVLGVAGIGALLALPTGSPTPSAPPVAATEPPPPAAPARASEQQVRQWFVDGDWSTSVNYGYITKVSWSGDTLVFDTRLYPDSDAKEPALWICGLGARYLDEMKQPVQVRVLGTDTGVLASRRGVLDNACGWRR